MWLHCPGPCVYTGAWAGPSPLRDVSFVFSLQTQRLLAKPKFLVLPSMSLTVTQTVQKLKLRRRKKVTWSADTVDNEHMNKKSSKICCIHHSKHGGECKDKNKYERG